MAAEIIVGMYQSRRDADAARARLIAEGIDERRITIEEGPAANQSAMPPGDRFASRAVDALPAADRGVPGFITRMASGALMDDADIEKYVDALRGGRCLLAVRTDTEAHARAAASILAPAGPRVYSLPNAPSAWNEATAGDPPTTSGVDRDPARPEGLLDDAEGFPVEADRARLARASRTSRNR